MTHIFDTSMKGYESMRITELIVSKMDEAYKKSPKGSWLQRFIPGVCKHEEIRCTHGDEIIHRRWRRRVCLICGRSLKGDLPYICFFTDKPHSSVELREKL